MPKLAVMPRLPLIEPEPGNVEDTADDGLQAFHLSPVHDTPVGDPRLAADAHAAMEP